MKDEWKGSGPRPAAMPLTAEYRRMARVLDFFPEQCPPEVEPALGGRACELAQGRPLLGRQDFGVEAHPRPLPSQILRPSDPSHDSTSGEASPRPLPRTAVAGNSGRALRVARSTAARRRRRACRGASRRRPTFPRTRRDGPHNRGAPATKLSKSLSQNKGRSISGKPSESSTVMQCEP